MDQEYDEFGNLIGDPFDSDAESSSNSMLSDAEALDDQQSLHEQNESTSQALIKHDNNAHQPEITYVAPQITNEAIITPADDTHIKIEIDHSKLPPLKYDYQYVNSLANQLPERIRNISVVGGLHSGKTSFLDHLIYDTYTSVPRKSDDKPTRLLDNHRLEIDRGISIKNSPMTLLLPDLSQKSYIFNLMDTPGHFNFLNESNTSLNHVEGAVLVVDIVEGFTPRDKQIVSRILLNNKPIVLVINKIDRLILELNLPVNESYLKINVTIDEINQFIKNHEFFSLYKYNHKPLLPNLNNVIFSSALFEFHFSVLSFAQLYIDANQFEIDPRVFAKRLWTDHYDKANSTFTKTAKFPTAFESFILEPIYKIFTHTLTSSLSDNKLEKILWSNFGVKLSKQQYRQDHRKLLKDIFKAIFGGYNGFVEAVKDIEAPVEVKGPHPSVFAKIISLIESPDTLKFSALVRIYKGSLELGQKVKVIGDNFSEDDENFKIETIDGLFIPGGRYSIPIAKASAGSVVIVDGIDSIISKKSTTSSITQQLINNDKLHDKSVFKVAIQPENPSELPKLLQGIRNVNKSYISCNINVEESGEIVLYGPGELYLDCILHDLRFYFTKDLEIKVSDPMTRFSETIIETSAAKIPVSTKSGHNQVSITAEPVQDSKLSKFIEAGKLDLSQPIRTTSKIMRNDFGWDALAARSIWSFGPEDMQFPNILMDDTLESETNKELIYSVKDSISLGFKWSVNEGPLCNEPIRGTKFKILDAVLSGSEIQRSSAQIIPMTRRACYTGFLTATPRLMEPIYTVYLTCTEACIRIVSKILLGRRGYILNRKPIPATKLFEVEGMVPVIESVGLETDIRLHTQGQAMCMFDFNKWEIVPGDPLDQDCFLPTLKPVPEESLARDFVTKTRKRKGLTGEITLEKYIDQELYARLKESGVVV
ncbi:P-loop containing nucleoside triphosphate hydrolase protein [Suhomyces tanzawaensis NRRL Y-17324]|uniref:p-loop containing nucleoside triphosphate hydrolase protein n=1 Tax=Suhomyces tanzawaensis NRRL Y-17324 TaxID=984487 RepID=A0A1E4SJY5_9ASCO|nr:P-loop containing nucleoside triphosphate hydrolase protein [Suhomyces tanzawaensis NRRL Y-17324]ODV79825.1 P-loop containing nucleoside triphosphate hydrolase protein [Suhomyces tanzawaensis NRRL Y-17324]